jgi:hypothetical protein
VTRVLELEQSQIHPIEEPEDAAIIQEEGHQSRLTGAGMQPEIERICAALSALRIPVLPEERQLHEMIAYQLEEAGIAAKHEANIAPRCRIDFLAGNIGIEVKRGRLSAARLRAQAARYLSSPCISALILVTTDFAPLPEEILGKPVVVFGLNRLWGVALP